MNLLNGLLTTLILGGNVVVARLVNEAVASVSQIEAVALSQEAAIGQGNNVGAECDYCSEDGTHVAQCPSGHFYINMCYAKCVMGDEAEEVCKVIGVEAAIGQGNNVGAECDYCSQEGTHVAQCPSGHFYINMCYAKCVMGDEAEEVCKVIGVETASNEGNNVGAECDYCSQEGTHVAQCPSGHFYINMCYAKCVMGDEAEEVCKVIGVVDEATLEA